MMLSDCRGTPPRPGGACRYLMALAVEAGRADTVRDWLRMSWRVQSGDRM
jgi:hypothetical protein